MSQFSIKVLLAFAVIAISGVHSGSIFPGAFWTDTDGIPIQAHGGGFIHWNHYWYWFGEDKTENSHHFRYVNAYRSSDLVTWELAGRALSASSTPGSEIGPDAVVERPKVIYNAATSTFVLWFHLDSDNYGLARLGVAISQNVEGPYTYLYSISPFGEDSRDMTVWVDEGIPNEPAYLVYATRVNLDTVIARLTDDYRNVATQLVKLEGIHREAYAVFKRHNIYYIVMSRATGWDSNPNEYMVSYGDMSGPWSTGRELAPTSPNTYDSQTNYVIPLGNERFMYCGSRWNRNALSDSRNVWLPMIFDDNDETVSISWLDAFSVDIDTGITQPSQTWRVEASTNTVTFSGEARFITCSGCSGQTAIGYVGNGSGRVQVGNVVAENEPSHSVQISYANGGSSTRTLSVDVNGQFQRNISFPQSLSGQTPTRLVFQLQLTTGANIIEFYNDQSYGPDLDYFMFVFGSSTSTSSSAVDKVVAITVAIAVAVVGAVNIINVKV